MLGTRTLGSYIATRFLMAILTTFLLCSVLIYLIDFVELLRQSGKQGEVPLPSLALIAILRLPAYAEFLIAFAVLVGSITALLQLSRKSELTVMRAGGMSVWQFLRPGIVVAFLIGVLTVTVFNPMAAAGRDAAEDLFAAQGFDATSLRQIAERAGIREPGLYNHFVGKQALYEAVLFRALNPMAEALSRRLESASSLREYTDLPATITDLLLEHPQMAALFQRALQGDSKSLGNQLVNNWLEKLFRQGMRNLEAFSGAAATGNTSPTEAQRATMAINLIAIFNLTTGYFLSQRAFASLAHGDLLDADNIARQKQLLHRVIRAMLVT